MRVLCDGRLSSRVHIKDGHSTLEATLRLRPNVGGTATNVVMRPIKTGVRGIWTPFGHVAKTDTVVFGEGASGKVGLRDRRSGVATAPARSHHVVL